jgi:hypothetical protein
MWQITGACHFDRREKSITHQSKVLSIWIHGNHQGVPLRALWQSHVSNFDFCSGLLKPPSSAAGTPPGAHFPKAHPGNYIGEAVFLLVLFL